MFDIGSTIGMILGFATFGFDVLLVFKITLDFRTGNMEERLTDHTLIGGEDFDLVLLDFEGLDRGFHKREWLCH